ncbi:hypothetical protein [Roseibium sp. Sym1]|uniref:hypothetical protein n=1 Tax=Roseibium sp. Sym1 TaxID=3016006 RepID=UPI0022B3E404|nr:hypothetical protein [Roseibium sp. Sym1]
MKNLFLSFALLGSIALLSTDVAGDDNINLNDLKPQFNSNDGPDYTKPAPKIETDYQRFEKKVKKLRESDGFGLSYDSENKAPVIIYKDSFN